MTEERLKFEQLAVRSWGLGALNGRAMTPLIIRYRDGEGTETERRISDLPLENSDSIDAFCHLRNERRNFVLHRIIHAIDAETGEIIDLPAMFGALVRLPPPKHGPTTRSAKEIEALRRGSEAYKQERNREKRELRKHFRLEVIYEHYKKKLFQSFGNHYAKCGRTAPPNLDHHVPIRLGGYLAPGNIVPLCRPCKMAKGDQSPQDFYSAGELNQIEYILKEQYALFEFTFDWKLWNPDRKGYLLSIGLDERLVC